MLIPITAMSSILILISLSFIIVTRVVRGARLQGGFLAVGIVSLIYGVTTVAITVPLLITTTLSIALSYILAIPLGIFGVIDSLETFNFAVFAGFLVACMSVFFIFNIFILWSMAKVTKHLMFATYRDLQIVAILLTVIFSGLPIAILRVFLLLYAH